MPVLYPGALHGMNKPGPTTYRDDPGYELDILVSQLGELAEALQFKVGIGASSPGASPAVLRRTATGASAWGLVTAADVAAVPTVIVTKTGNQAIADNTLTPITWDSEVIDNDTMHDNAANTSRLTATTAGLYAVVLFAWFDNGTTGYRFAGIRQSGANYRGNFRIPAVTVASTELCSVAHVQMTAGDYVEAIAVQTQGSSLNLMAASRFSMARIGA